MNTIYPNDFWDILTKFPNIRNLSDITRVLIDIEHNKFDREFPSAYALLRDFESSMRSHIYMEHHAAAFISDEDYDYS